MHIFLQGQRNIGKSTVIRKTLDILAAYSPLAVGGFFTWNGGKDNPYIFMQCARNGGEGEIYRLAHFDECNGSGLVCDLQVFEQDGVRLLGDSKGANLIIMDELGYLESSATMFKQAVMDLIAGDIPIFGVLRLWDVPWHRDIKRNPLVTLVDVDEVNRDVLPQELARMLILSLE